MHSLQRNDRLFVQTDGKRKWSLKTHFAWVDLIPTESVLVNPHFGLVVVGLSDCEMDFEVVNKRYWMTGLWNSVNVGHVLIARLIIVK